MSPLALTFSGGVWIVLAVFAVAFAAVIFSYFTDRGTEIRFHAWEDRGGDAPGSSGVGNVGKDPTLDVGSWYRGYPSRRRRNLARPATRSPMSAGDRQLLERLGAWRDHLTSESSGLAAAPDPSRDHIRGPADAPLQLVGYSDFECPSCQLAARVVNRVRRQLGDELLVVVRHFPVVDAHPMAMFAAEAVEAADAQGRFWDLYTRIYYSRRPPTKDSVRRHAGRLHLDMPRFESELDHHTHTARVLEDFDTGVLSGVNGTPTFFVNGIRHDDEHTVDSLLSALNTARNSLPRASTNEPTA
jgi:predicted DsbA family dithiol-disulfide isomerase